MNFDIFSNNENYLMENIPKNMNYFKKKKWIKEKLAFMGHAKSLIFADQSFNLHTYSKIFTQPITQMSLVSNFG